MTQTVNRTESERTLGALLRLPYEHLARKLYAELAWRGFPELRVSHSPVLRYIAPDGSRITELAERAGITKQSMGYLIDSLAQAGYVELVPDPADGRARLARLSSRGREAHRTAMQLSKDYEDEYAGFIGPENMRELRRLLELLTAELNARS